MRAELLEDHGAQAETDDFFRSRPFYEAEQVTHSLVVSDGAPLLAMPLIVRPLPQGEGRDATSPYGYPGAARLRETDPVDPQAVEWGATGLVSIFAREAVGGGSPLAGARRRSLLQVHDPARPREVRARLAEQARQNERRGYHANAIPGPDTESSARSAFHALYSQTMRRTGAAERYLYGKDYFEQLLAFPRSWLVLVTAPGGALAAGALVGRSDGVLHYYLGGTADDALQDSPFKNAVLAMLDLADEEGAPLNLGGGLRPGDGLEAFKRGFANSTLPFSTHEIVCDADAYERLSAGAPATEFFPAYRAAG